MGGIRCLIQPYGYLRLPKAAYRSARIFELFEVREFQRIESNSNLGFRASNLWAIRFVKIREFRTGSRTYIYYSRFARADSHNLNKRDHCMHWIRTQNGVLSTVQNFHPEL